MTAMFPFYNCEQVCCLEYKFEIRRVKSKWACRVLDKLSQISTRRTWPLKAILPDTGLGPKQYKYFFFL
jgi:hypothetical protein